MFGLNANKSDSSSNMNQNVWGPQGDAMGSMYGNLNQGWQNMQPMMNMGMGMMNQAQPWMNQAAGAGAAGSGYMQAGGGYGDTSGMRDNLYSSLQDSMNNPSQMGKMYEDIVGGPGNTYIDPMVESMKTGAMDNLERMQSGTGLDAAAMGQGGSNRHAMQNAMQSKEINQDMMNQENLMRGNAYDTDMNWKMDIAQQADLGRGQAQDRAMAAIGAGDANRQYGTDFQTQQQNLGMGTMAPWMNAMYAPMNMQSQYSQQFGDPTVLTDSKSKGSSMGGGFGF